MKKSIVVIGAGPCGLAAVKEMIAAGHEVRAFERSSGLGGVFASAATYPDLHLTISNWAMSFSDFPDPHRLCYPSAEAYLLYLKDYARNFALDDHISYHSEVYSASLQKDGRWSLEIWQRYPSAEDTTVLRLQADAIIVTTGANQVPKETPDSLAGFTGKILHSGEYNEAFKKQVKNEKQRVLVVGGGESGADVSAELGELSPHVTVWLRRPNCIGPRYLNTASETEQMEQNKSCDFPANAFLEAATMNRMSAGQNAYAYGAFRRLLWSTKAVLNPTLSQICLESTRLAPLLNDQATYVTKNQRMCEALHQRKIEALISPTVKANDTLCDFVMADGMVKQRSFDAIVLCHGYRTEFPWLKVPVSPNSRDWFLHCFPPDLGHSLFFVGYARPHQGGIPCAAEMLSRYIGLLLRGDKSLPGDYASLARDNQLAEREYYSLSPDLHTLIDYNAFMESIARRIGCEPRLPTSCVVAFNFHMLAVTSLMLRCFHFIGPQLGHLAFALWLGTLVCFLLLEDGLLFKWWFYPHWSVWYRQRGPGADSTLLQAVLNRVSIWRATAITKGFMLLLVWSMLTMYMQRLLSVPLFVMHTILAAFGLRFTKGRGGMLRPKIFTLHETEWRFSDLFLP
ncbi:hypothetical protein Daus18300_001162 [Diaporthe australafricana]|uniref:Uncharacterized protein n=1 Tax=Diaporthe australafricana TaxID=127596 RepID=A0ABR3XZY6_9PEZI